MSIIVPTITVETEDQYKEKIESHATFAKRIHVDVSDGEFAPTFLVASDKIWWPAELLADVHAMVARPSEHVQQLIAKKPNLITFHVEVQEDLLPTIQMVKQSGIKVGVALMRSTVPSSVKHIIEQVDHVMIFTAELGHYGGTASMMQLEKVQLIRDIKPGVEISWDGGVNVQNAFTLAQGGIDVLNVGGAIAKSTDPAEAYTQLTNEINKHGVI